MIRSIRRSMDRARNTLRRHRPPRPEIPEDLTGWMTLEELERNDARLPNVDLQISACGVHGMVFGKLFTDRYRDTPREELLRMRDERRALVTAAGIDAFVGPASLVHEVEMLDNLLEYHLAPPCGCPPAVGGAAVGDA